MTPEHTNPPPVPYRLASDGPDIAKWIMTPARILGAQLVAEDELTDKDIAARCDVSRNALCMWKQQPAFRQHVQTLRDAIAETVKSEGIALIANRIRAKQDRWRRLQTVVQQRAERTPKEHPGADSGFIAVNRHGEGKVDTGLLEAIENLEDSVAEEMGQRKGAMSSPQIMIVVGSGATVISGGDGQQSPDDMIDVTPNL